MEFSEISYIFATENQPSYDVKALSYRYSDFLGDDSGEGTAQKALEQIDSKCYAIPYQTDGRRIVKVGVKFNADTRVPEDWVAE